jgi:glyoxylase-like metal-dependent hydrolase (beta-lactamase superfamily II)
MKAWGLLLSLMVACAGCSTLPVERPVDRYGGPAMPDIENFDRAGVDVIRGFFQPGRQPDGNTVVFASADGLIVFDTGRHAEHVQKIAELAEAKAQPVAAIINSHWHLDHNSGNIPLRQRWPSAVVYANDTALGKALDGFLQKGLASNRRMVADPATPAALAEDLRGDIATVEQSAALRASVSVETNRTIEIGGRRLSLRSAAGASEGDIWIHDAASGLVAAGDLITLPAPFLDTACPEAWRNALDAILHSPFKRLVPGHGHEMNRAEVELYRTAFNALLDCASGDAPVAACADAWAASAAPLLDEASGGEAAAKSYAAYYAGEILRPRKFRADCPA